MAWGDKFLTKTRSVKPNVWLSFKADRLSGSVSTSTDAQYLYIIANECLSAFTINVEVGKSGDLDHRKFVLSRRKRKGKRYFSDHYNTYTLPYHHAKDLNDLFHAHDAGKLKMKITMEIRYGLFAEYILRYIARTSADGGAYHNIANPASADQITKLDNKLTKVWHSKDFGKKHKFKTKYKIAKGSQRLITVPCMLSDRDVNNSGKRSKVKLYIYLRIKEDLPTNKRDEVTQKIVAADYHKLIKYGRYKYWNNFPFDIDYLAAGGPSIYDISGKRYSPPTSIGSTWTNLGMYTSYLKEKTPSKSMEKAMRVWYKNVFTYFLNYVDIDRGKKIRKELVKKAKSLAADATLNRQQIVMKFRDAVDKYLITANHWHGSRERFKKEVHQHIFSDTFGEIHGKRYYGGSPVFFVREVPEDAVWWKRDPVSGTSYWKGSQLYWLGVCKKSWTDEEKIAYCLQVGAGHCGEHASVCYSIIKEAINTDATVKSKFKNVIYTGNANIDHAFCMINMVAKTVYYDKRTKKWGKLKKGEALRLWDLKKEIDAGQTNGVVLDAYLGSLQVATCQRLLKKIKRKEKTHYLNFRSQSPDSATTTIKPTVAVPDPLPDI